MRAFVRGRIPHRRVPEGAAILVDNGGRIAAIEEESSLDARGWTPLERIDLGGGLVLPAFQDAHTHLCQTGRFLARPDLGRARSLCEALETARRHRIEKTEGAIFLEGYDESMWPEGRGPHRGELDAIEPSRPLIARRVCGHIAAANREALARIPMGTAGVDRTTGRLEEEVVFRLEEDFFPPSLEENREAILRAQALAFSLGIAAVHELDAPPVAEAYRSLDCEGKLRLRVFFYARAHPEEVAKLRGREASGNFRVAGAKVFLDGSIGGRTAAVREPYPAGGCGELLLDVRRIRELLRSARAVRVPIAFHAIGDRAVGALLDACAEDEDALGGLPHRIEHAEMLGDAEIERIRVLGFRLSMQPNFPRRWGGAGGMYEDRLGARRARSLNRFGSAVRAGIPIAFGSDCMPLDPFYGIEGAAGHPSSEERIDREEALRLYTSAAESLVPGGGDGGALEPGRRADFNVYSEEAARDGILDRERLLLSVVGGEIAHARER
jgi:predicted amidohydrolase YtcJ